MAPVLRRGFTLESAVHDSALQGRAGFFAEKDAFVPKLNPQSNKPVLVVGLGRFGIAL